MSQRERIVELLFKAAKEEWRAYNDALQQSDRKQMDTAYATVVKFLGILCRAGYMIEVRQFIAENEMPRNKILKRIQEIEVPEATRR